MNVTEYKHTIVIKYAYGKLYELEPYTLIRWLLYAP